MEGRSRIMNFGKALELMKSGNKLSRKGWNGKNMFAVYQKGYP
ncbi:Thoeris anti-defense Tad2 family protein, partial [Bacillus thuringiensis]